MVEVVVVGSINQDVSVMTPRLPNPGETVAGTEHFFGPGGKGANQAVAASRLGARTAMIGRVGQDAFGRGLVDNLKREGVDVTAVGVDPAAATGVAVITIDGEAENTIVGSLGANLALTPEHLDEHRDLIARSRVVLAQLEIPIETVSAAAEMTSGTFILVPAPARTLPDDLIDQVDILVPNRGELALLTGHTDLLDAASEIDTTVVVTLGSDGAMISDQGHNVTIPAYHVNAIDTTGAGDAFAGALAAYLAAGHTLEQAVQMATAAGALAVTRLGAQSALPTSAEVEALIAG